MRSYKDLIRKIIYSSPLLIMFLFTWCEEEKPVAREYPRLTATSVINISDSGATFTADLYSMGTEAAKEYGFLWDVYGELDYNSSNKVILGKPEKTGVFTADISSALIKDREYNVRPFVKTEDKTVYGPVSSFKSLGSKAPVIYGFYPGSGGWGDTIKISGRNFSWITGSNEVSLNNIPCRSTESTDTTLLFVIDQNVVILKNAISVTLAGNRYTFRKDSLRLIPPSITDYNPKNGYWGDTIRISGKYLGFLNSLQTQSIKLGNQNCTVIGIPVDSLIKIKVPFEMSTASNNLVVTMNAFVLNGSVPFNLLPPYFSFSPVEGTWGNKILLTGRFNIINSRNKVFFNNSEATISSVGINKLQVTVPNGLSESASDVIYKVSPFEISSGTQFKLKPPIFTSFSPLSGPSGTKVTILGKFFGINPPVVKFGDITGSVSSVNDSIIVLNVPAGGYGPVKISVTVAGQTVVSESDFDVKNPHINRIYPLTGTFYDEITIEGENFRPAETYVNFGVIGATVTYKSETTIKVRVPVNIDSLPRQIKVYAGTNYEISQDMFTLSPPEIFSITPSSLTGNEDIVISGKNFNPDLARNSVIIDMCYLEIKSAANNQIVATARTLPRGSFRLKVISGGYSRFSDQVFTIDSRWLRIPSPALKTYNTQYRFSMPVTGEGLNDIGYLCSLADNGMTYKFNPVGNTWTKTSESLNAIYSTYFYNIRKFVSKDTLYMVYGRTPVLSGISTISDNWNSKPVSLLYNEYPMYFSINDKIYFGGSNRGASANYFYVIDPSSNYSKTRITDFPTYFSADAITCFSIGKTGYVLFSNNFFWKFDSETQTWTRLADFPGTARFSAISFVINGFGYMGTGVALGSKYLDDIWKYNPLTDSWTFETSIPGARDRATALVINGKAYIGFGSSEYPQYTFIDHYDFYEFDPNYPLK